MLSAQQEPVFYILDLSRLRTISMEGVMKSAEAASQSPNSNLRHPMNRCNIMVSKESIIQLAAKGMSSPKFGNIEIKLFETLDEALEYVKNES